MSNKANKCPKCSSYILGEYCYICNIDIRNYIVEDETVQNLKDILGINDEEVC